MKNERECIVGILEVSQFMLNCSKSESTTRSQHSRIILPMLKIKYNISPPSFPLCNFQLIFSYHKNTNENVVWSVVLFYMTSS